MSTDIRLAKVGSIGIRATTKRTWPMTDFSKPANSASQYIPAGTYELERMPHPRMPGVTCLVLKGTQVGMTIGCWLDWVQWEGDPEFEIVLEEDGQLMVRS